MAEDFYSVSLFYLFLYCSLILPLGLSSDMNFQQRQSHPLPHLLDFLNTGMDIFFLRMLWRNILSLSINQHSWTFGYLVLRESFLHLCPLNKEKSALNSEIFILALVFLTTLKIFQLGLHYLVDNHCSPNGQIVTSLTCYVFVNILSAPLLKNYPQHTLEISNITCNQQNIHMIRGSHEH